MTRRPLGNDKGGLVRQVVKSRPIRLRRRLQKPGCDETMMLRFLRFHSKKQI